MRQRVKTALRAAAELIAVLSVFAMLYLLLWVGYYAGMPM